MAGKLKRPGPRAPALPSEAEILAFIQASPSIVGKREIARHFAVKGAGKIALKSLLKRLADEGKLARRQRKLIDTSTLPPVTVLEIAGIDKDGEAFAEPVEWDERLAGKPPRIVIEGGIAGRKGDRVLAKIAPARDGRYRLRLVPPHAEMTPCCPAGSAGVAWALAFFLL